MSKGAYSISIRQGKIATRHDRREYTPENTDERLKIYNKTIVDLYADGKSDEEVFNSFFADSVDEYNAKQKRNDRKKKNYYEEINSEKRAEKPFYEYVIQIGNHEDNGITNDDFDVEKWGTDKSAYDIDGVLNKSQSNAELRQILDAKMAELPTRYPNFRFSLIQSHGDEPNGTYHYHVKFTPVATGYKKGMTEQCSLSKALENMGYKTAGADYAITQWQNDVKKDIEEAMNIRGYEKADMENENDGMDMSLFKLQTQKETLLNQNELLNVENQDLKADNKNLFNLNLIQKDKLAKATLQAQAITDNAKNNAQKLELEMKRRIQKMTNAEKEKLTQATLLKEKAQAVLQQANDTLKAIQATPTDNPRLEWMRTFKFSNGRTPEDYYRRDTREREKNNAHTRLLNAMKQMELLNESWNDYNNQHDEELTL